MTAAGRLFKPDEINRILGFLAGDDPFDLGGGLVAVRMASKDKPIFRIDRNGSWGHFVEECPPEEIGELSAVLWERGKEYLPATQADVEGELIPDELREQPDPDNLALDPLGLTPDRLRDIIADPGLARRLAKGTGTPAASADDLIPDNLK